MDLTKKGIFFSMDALIALAVVLLGMLIIIPLANNQSKEVYTHKDLIKALSSISIGEYNNSMTQTLINTGQITNQNETVLEALGALYVTNETAARLLGQEILNNLNGTENLGIWFGDKLIASKNTTPFNQAKNVIVETQTISGIQEGTAITAFSGRAYLTSNLQSTYSYFGGYVGEGNITVRIDYSGNISSAKMELATRKNFSLYINSNYEGVYNGSLTDTTPLTYNLPITHFHNGSNIIELKGDLLGIAGGFIKVSYKPEVTYSTTTKQYLPGIHGVINLYDGFYIPGILNNLEIFLSFNNSVSTFLNIGNTTVFNQSTLGLENFTLNNTYLSGLLNYSTLQTKTTPLRFGIANLSGLPGIDVEADIMSVVDLSGSMNYQCSNPSSFCQSQWICTNWCSGTWNPTKPVDQAKNATKQFAHDVLNYVESRVGLVPYSDKAITSKSINLTNNETAIINTVNGWSANGGTCICCGINSAVNELITHSNSSRFRTLVVMTDGIANAQCSEQNTGNANQDAIKAACDAYNNYSIRTFAVGFGSGTNETALIQMASCAHGSYYSTIDDLLAIYGQIAEELLEIIYVEQSINYTSSTYSKLGPESYLAYNYNQTTTPNGLITTTEKLFDNQYGGSFNLPTNATILDATLISYSGSKWTETASINGNLFYNISEYGTSYIKLGDPYSIKIPLNLINNTNIVNLTTASDYANTSSGSSYNKIIYTILQKDAAAFSKLSTSSQGCNWTLEFQDGTYLTTPIPKNYTGTEPCYYTSAGQNVTNQNDAMQTAVEKLLGILDYDNDGRIDVAFNEQDLQISSAQISGIPFDWSTEMQVRSWT